MTDEDLRTYISVLSFLLAALAFLANERREAVRDMILHGPVATVDKAIAVLSVGLMLIAATGLTLSAWPAVHATGLSAHDLLRLDSVIRQAFAMGWFLLVAITLALAALFVRALGIKTT